MYTEELYIALFLILQRGDFHFDISCHQRNTCCLYWVHLSSTLRLISVHLPLIPHSWGFYVQVQESDFFIISSQVVAVLQCSYVWELLSQNSSLTSTLYIVFLLFIMYLVTMGIDKSYYLWVFITKVYITKGEC